MSTQSQSPLCEAVWGMMVSRVELKCIACVIGLLQGCQGCVEHQLLTSSVEQFNDHGDGGSVMEP